VIRRPVSDRRGTARVAVFAVLSLALLATGAAGGLAADSGTATGGTGPGAGQPDPLLFGWSLAQTAGCTATPQEVHPGDAVTLDASASTDAGYVEFDTEPDDVFEETDETDLIVTVTYAEPGTYEPLARAVGIEQTDTSGCGTVEVTENAAPTVEVTHSPDPAVTGEVVTFDASGSFDADGSIVEYRWDVDGDDSVEATTTDPVTTHTYDSAGAYDAALTVVDDDGATDTGTRDVVVEETATPVASCRAAPQEVSVGETVTLDAAETTNAEYVEFDKEPDGVYDKGEETSVADSVTVTYTEPGTYEPRLRARNGDRTDTDDCGTVTVTGGNDPPGASFTVSPQPGVVEEPVAFDASASNDTDGSVVEYRWDFDGDGTVETTTGDPAATYTYARAGTYDASLTVVDDANATETAARSVRVVEETGPVARCTASPQTVEPGEAVTLDASASTGVDYAEFDTEPDGAFEETDETDFTVTVTYAEPGTYEPGVRAWNYTGVESSATADCGQVTVAGNEPPTPRVDHDPAPAVVDQPVTLDASDSTDSDGSIVEYRWDVDGDGAAEETTAGPTTDRTFPYDATSPGVAVVGLEVVDDDGATARTNYTLELVRPELSVACSVGTGTVEPGDGVVVDAAGSENAAAVRFDVDGDGEYERSDETDLRETVVYERPGTYEVRVELTGPDGATADGDCGSVRVEDGNAPPIAVLTHVLQGSDGRVLLDGSNSTDVDGRVAEYRWDVDDDGTIETTTTDPSLERTFANGTHAVGLVVVDDDGATDRAVDRITVGDRSESGVPLWPIPVGTAGGGLLGYALCRGRTGSAARLLSNPSRLFSGPSQAVEAQATGAFRTPGDSGTVRVSGLGFEPDVLLFTVTSNADDGAPDRTDGWSYGKAIRHEDGTVAQNAVSVADDARSVAAATGAVTTDRAINLHVYDEEGVTTLAGSLDRTTPDGFEMRFDAADLPDGKRYTATFQAFAIDADADVAVGHVPVPDEPETQSVPLGFEADYAIVTGTDAVGDADSPDVTGEATGVCHGQAVVSEDGVDQQVLTSSVDPRRVDQNRYAASSERAVHLLGPADGDPEAKTAARVTDLGGHVELTYDEVASEGVVSFLAVETGEEGRPAIGHVDVPAPDGDDRVTVDVGFEPAVAEFTASNVDAVGGTRSVDESPLSFGWSHGTTMLAGDTVHQHMLHGAYDAADPNGLPPAARSAGPRAGSRADGGQPAPGEATGDSQASDSRPQVPRSAYLDSDPGDEVTLSRYAGSSDAVAAPLAIGADGVVLGRDELRVSRVTTTGFELAVSDVSTGERGDVPERRPVVSYTVWPVPGGHV